jgi:putative transposase
MSQIITVKVKLNHNTQQKQQLDKISLNYRDAINYVSTVAFNHNKLSNKIKIQELTYCHIRNNYSIGSQMACSIARDVGAKYKTQWTKLKQHQENVTKGYTKKHYRGLDKPIRFNARTITLQYKKDFSFNFAKQLVSVPTLNGRIKISYSGWNKHTKYLKSSVIGAANLWYDKTKKQYYLLVSIKIPTKEINPANLSNVVGCDLGQRYLATTQSDKGEVKFYSGRQVKHIANQFALKRKELQVKGTRSATRKLVEISKRERRFKQNVNHSLSKIILKPDTLIGLEDLTHIRIRTKRKKGRKASVKQRQANCTYSKWAFAELGNYLEYKAKLIGSSVIKVDADYTSKGCPKCGHISDKNRPNKGLNFNCVSCNYHDHSDRIGAINILMRATLVRQCLTGEGSLSAYLNVNSDEAKAVRLNAFSELRWS